MRFISGLMRFIFGFLSGLIGMLAGGLGLAFLVAALVGPGGQHSMGNLSVFLIIGPIGGLVGFIVGVVLFIKKGIVRESAPSPGAEQSGAATGLQTHVSRPFAIYLLVLAGGIAWWAWYEFIRSPYLTHGYMTLDLQFRLPPDMILPPRKEDVYILVKEGWGQQYWPGSLGESWRGHDGDRQVILATASLSYKTSYRVVYLTLPGRDLQWQPDLSYDPDPTPGYSAWRLPRGTSATKIEMNFRLRADR
jgi:hypothetical protein